MINALLLFAAPIHPIPGLWTSYLILAASIIGALAAGRMRHYLLMYAFGATGLVFGAVTTHTFQQSFIRENQEPPSMQKQPDRLLVAELTSRPFRPVDPVVEEAPAVEATRPKSKVEKQPVKAKIKPAAEKKKTVGKPAGLSKPVRPEKKKAAPSGRASRFRYVGTFNNGLAPVKGKNGKWGYIDSSDRQIVPCFLEMACTFHSGLGGVMNSKGKWGFINREGDLIIPYIYDQALAFEEHSEQAMINMDGQWYWINREGTVLRDATYGDLRARHRI